MDNARVLIVEDDERLGALLAEYLRENGLRVDVVRRGDLAIPRILDTRPDVVVLDLMLPGADGFEVLRRTHGRHEGRVLMLTARRGDVDQILGLELGADDYVTKPVDPRLLLARVRALLRRASPQNAEPARVALGGLVVDPGRREAVAGERPVTLTSAEFDLLWLLARHAGTVVHRDQLYEALRGMPYDGLDRGMDIHISRLRRKLRDAGLSEDLIKSVRGVGYQLACAT